MFCHVNVPLMRGHSVDADRGQDILFIMSLLKWTISENIAKITKYFDYKMATDKTPRPCSVTEQKLNFM